MLSDVTYTKSGKVVEAEKVINKALSEHPFTYEFDFNGTIYRAVNYKGENRIISMATFDTMKASGPVGLHYNKLIVEENNLSNASDIVIARNNITDSEADDKIDKCK